MVVPPSFMHYPGAVDDGRVHPSDVVCAACSLSRGWISEALLYSATVPDEAQFCPWCIADGSAVRAFGGSFNELDAPDLDNELSRAVSERTPNFESWQDIYWPGHCGVPTIYLGQPFGSELRADPAALQALLEALRPFPWSQEAAQVDAFIDGLGGGHSAYLFECPTLGQARAVDSD